MVASRACKFTKDDEERCQAPPMHDSEYCFVHAPEYAEEMAEARRLGGLRRRREKVVEGTYEIGELESVPEVRRLVRIAVLDGLSLENSIARARLLVAAAQTAAKLLEAGETEERLRALERAMLHRQPAKLGRRRR